MTPQNLSIESPLFRAHMVRKKGIAVPFVLLLAGESGYLAGAYRERFIAFVALEFHSFTQQIVFEIKRFRHRVQDSEPYVGFPCLTKKLYLEVAATYVLSSFACCPEWGLAAKLVMQGQTGGRSARERSECERARI